MPRRVDHEVRRREITDAVVRLTMKGGLQSATFREVAAEAGVSVRLVQYYFGTKGQLLLTTQRHVAERAVERINRELAAAGPSPRSILRAILGSFIPVDQETRENMLMFVALHTASLVDPLLSRPEASEVPRSLQDTVAAELARAKTRAGVDPKREAAVLTAMVPSLAQAVLDGSLDADGALELIDYALDRALLSR